MTFAPDGAPAAGAGDPVAAAGPVERAAQAVDSRSRHARLNFFTRHILCRDGPRGHPRFSYDRRGGFMKRITAVMFGLLMLAAVALDFTREQGQRQTHFDITT